MSIASTIAKARGFVATAACLVPAVIACIGLGAPAAQAQSGDYRITLLHTNDVLSQFEPVTPDGRPCTLEERAGDGCYGGAARLAGQINVERSKARTSLVLDAGGMFTGSNFWTQHNYRGVLEVMNRIGFDAMAAGHGEFAEGSETLARFIREARFPVLGANVNTDRDPFLKDQIFPMLVTDRGGDRIGLLGILDDNTPSLSRPAPTTRFQSIEGALPFWIKQMGYMGVNKIIAVSYAGLERDKQIAQKVSGIDVIIGGNSKVLMGNKVAGATGPYPLVTKGARGSTVLLAQGGAHGRFLGRLDVVFDRGGNLKSWSGDAIALDRTVPEDPEIRAVVDGLANSQKADVKP